jgi:hypothetical protein
MIHVFCDLAAGLMNENQTDVKYVKRKSLPAVAA